MRGARSVTERGKWPRAPLGEDGGGLDRQGRRPIRIHFIFILGLGDDCFVVGKETIGGWQTRELEAHVFCDWQIVKARGEASDFSLGRSINTCTRIAALGRCLKSWETSNPLHLGMAETMFFSLLGTLFPL